MVLPPAARAVRDALDRALHDSDRRIGVVTGGHVTGLYLAVLTEAEAPNEARTHALRLVRAALDELELAELAQHVEVGDVVGRRILAGKPRLVEAAPPLDYRSARLPDGRTLLAGHPGPLGEWSAYTDEDPGRIVAGRSLLGVLSELFELPWGKKDAWVYDLIEQLAGYPTSHGIRYACPCCDHLTLEEPPPGTFDICEVCRWEDDGVQFSDPDYPGGANRASLREARENYRRQGRSELGRGGPTRPPLPHERPPLT